jgi:hypothetical protein
MLFWRARLTIGQGVHVTSCRSDVEYKVLASRLLALGRQDASMRAVVGLVVLGLVGGVVPTGLSGFAHAGQVLAGTVGALLSLAVCCVVGAVFRA